MNETRYQRRLREALGPDPVPACSAAAARVMFVFAMLAAVGFTSSLGTHNVPIVNASDEARPVVIADASMLAAIAPDGDGEE